MYTIINGLAKVPFEGVLIETHPFHKTKIQQGIQTYWSYDLLVHMVGRVYLVRAKFGHWLDFDPETPTVRD